MSEIESLIEQFKNLETSGLLIQLAQLLLWIIFILILVWLARKAINRTITNNTMRYRARKIARYIGFALILLLAIITFTGRVQYFTLAIGLIVAGIAFALQELILSVAGWVAIFSSGIYKPGDRVEINNVKGDVIDIGLTRTTLMEIGEWIRSDNYNGRIVQVSNSLVFKGTVRNYSLDFPFVWDEINLPIRYGSDIRLARQIISDTAHQFLDEYANYAKEYWKQMVRKYLIENANVEPTVTLQLTDNWIEFNLRFVVDYKKRRTTKNALFTEIYERIQKSEGKVALASATFEVTDLPDLNVRISERK